MRVAGTRLQAGTYRLVARAAGRIFLSRRFVIASERPGRRELLAALRQDVCGATTAAVAVPPVLARTFAAAPAAAAQSPASTPSGQSGASGSTVAAGHVVRPRRPEPFASQVLGAVFTKPLTQTPLWLRPILVAFLAAAIGLLALAALPQAAIPGARVTALVAHRRLELALFGICIVAAVAIVASLL